MVDRTCLFYSCYRQLCLVLRLSHPLAHLPPESLKALEHEASMYNAGWSGGPGNAHLVTERVNLGGRGDLLFN